VARCRGSTTRLYSRTSRTDGANGVSHARKRDKAEVDYSLAAAAALVIKFALKVVFKYARYPPKQR
jgi:hypothetical protein